MESRELLELANALPKDYVHPVLDCLPDDLIEDLTREIMQRAPVKTVLFAQTSLYWRSVLYLQQLQDIVSMRFDEEQERLLTNLLMNFPMLQKGDAQKNIPYWVRYLRGYCLDLKIGIKNRVYAKALLVVLDTENASRHRVEFDGLLHLYCFVMQRAPKRYLHVALKVWLAKATGQEAWQVPLFNIKDLLGMTPDRLDSVYEAQLILSSVFGQQQALISTILAQYANMGYYERCTSSYIFLLHAAARITSKRDEHLLLLSRLSELGDERHDVSCAAARLDFMTTLLKNVPSDRDLLQARLAEGQGKVGEGAAIIGDELAKARRVCSLATDDERIAWLREWSDSEAFDRVLLAAAQKILLLLASDGAREQAAYVLIDTLRDESGFFHSSRHNDSVVLLIGALLARISSRQVRVSLAQALYSLYTSEWVFTIKAASFLFHYLPAEVYQPQLQEQFHALKCMVRGSSAFIAEFCRVVTNASEIDDWVSQFRLLIEAMPASWEAKNYVFWRDIADCYTNLLVKKQDAILLHEWQLILQRMHGVNAWWGWESEKMAMRMWPYLKEEVVEQWMVWVKETLLGAGYEACLDVFLPVVGQQFLRLSAERQRECWGMIRQCLLLEGREFGSRHVLRALPNLLAVLPDEWLLEWMPREPLSPRPTHE